MRGDRDRDKDTTGDKIFMKQEGSKALISRNDS